MSFLYLEEFTGLMHNIETLLGESLTHHLFAWDLPFLTNNNQGSMCQLNSKVFITKQIVDKM
jgi:hypothetical protein